ncbi:MAG TPA: zf-HC2 domain-containing protein [Pyrinomonadaceae bacterium]|nr:zf-HC2 domain-containing protein [Pyrinomonadaceae bacterium]
MECSEFDDIADLYLGDELQGETNHEVLQHLEGCAACRRELAARREFRARLRAAFYGDAAFSVRPEFEERLRADLRSKALGPAIARPALFRRINGWPVAIAASLLIAVGIGLFTLQQRRLSQPPPADVATTGGDARTAAKRNVEVSVPPAQHQESPGVRNTSFALSEAAIGDHRDCAIKFNLAEDPIDLEEAGRKYDAAFTNLTSVVKTRSEDSAGQFEFIESHSCVFKGQRFAHVVLNHRGSVVSFLIAEREQDGKNTRTGQAAPPNDARLEVVACSSSGQFQVSCFETARHVVFVVSDLREADNLAVARAFAPALHEHIARSENTA